MTENTIGAAFGAVGMLMLMGAGGAFWKSESAIHEGVAVLLAIGAVLSFGLGVIISLLGRLLPDDEE